MLPGSKYTYVLGSEKGLVSEAEDAIQDLLRWLYASNVLKTADRRVITGEELRFVVKSDEVSSSPWKATVCCFDVRSQEDITVTFEVVQQ